MFKKSLIIQSIVSTQGISCDHDRRTGFRLALPDQPCPRYFCLVKSIITHESQYNIPADWPSLVGCAASGKKSTPTKTGVDGAIWTDKNSP
jgi:hypothetical protein